MISIPLQKFDWLGAMNQQQGCCILRKLYHRQYETTNNAPMLKPEGFDKNGLPD